MSTKMQLRRYITQVTALLTVLALLPTLYVTFLETQGPYRDGYRDTPSELVSDEVVRAAKSLLREGERWALVTAEGRCEKDPERFHLLAFRMMPSLVDCINPGLTIHWNIQPETMERVVHRGAGFFITRP